MFNAMTPLCECLIPQELGCVHRYKVTGSSHSRKLLILCIITISRTPGPVGISPLRRGVVLRNAVEVSFDQSLRSNQWPDTKEDK